MAAGRAAQQQADLEAKLQAAVEAHEEAGKQLKQAQEASQPVRRERGYYVVESQQMRTQIDVCRQRIEELKLLIQVKEREAEEIEDRTHAEIQVYRQKVKHLMHTQRKELNTIEADRAQAQDRQLQEHQNVLKGLETDATHLVGEYMTTQGQHAMTQHTQKDEFDRQTTRLREQYAARLQELDDEHARNMETLFEDYELQRINEIHEIQERKDHHIRRLMKSHDKSFKAMKDFYNRITQDHLSMISRFEAELADMEMRYKEYEQCKKDYQKEINELNRKLAEKKAENNNLHKILSTYESDKMALANSRARIQLLGREIEALNRQHGAKEAKFKRMEQERDMLLEKFEASVHDVRQKTEFRALLLEKKVTALGEVLQKKEGQIDELLETANVSGEQLQELAEKVGAVLTAKNEMMANLEYELARATKNHNDLISIYQAKMTAAGVPTDELVFQPLPADTTSAPAPSLFK
jgi:chromosome segregation ATPase